MTPIPASSQFKAIAYLRWRLFRNGLRRKGGAGELAARILVYPIFAGFIIGPVVVATSSAYLAVEHHHPEYLAPVFWAIFALRVLVSINISQPGQSFDPEALIRFPLTFPRFLTVRIFLGLLSASTIIGTLALLGAATGASVADASLAPAAFAAALSLAVADMFLIRMVFAWVDRWLSTRRAPRAAHRADHPRFRRHPVPQFHLQSRLQPRSHPRRQPEARHGNAPLSKRRTCPEPSAPGARNGVDRRGQRGTHLIDRCQSHSHPALRLGFRRGFCLAHRARVPRRESLRNRQQPGRTAGGP